MSYEFYKVVHVLMIIVFFGSLGATLYSSENPKSQRIITGLSSFLILVGGMGLLARLGVSHGEGFPGWVTAKIVIWLFLSALAPILNKRLSPAAKKKSLYFFLFLGFLAIYIAVLKPF